MEPMHSITNNRTGQTIQVPQSQLANYGIQLPQMQQPQTSTPQPQGGGLWPLVGSIAGSLIGLPFGLPGVAIGGGIGGGVAAKLSGGNVGKEALLGTIGGLLPIGRLGRVAGAGARAAEEAAAQAGARGAEQAGTRFTADIAGNVADRFAQGVGVQAGAQAATEAGVRPGSALAAKTLASNFIVPTKSGRAGINIEDALNKAIQDRTIPGPMTMGGYKAISNDIVQGITQGRQFIANNIQAPINYEQPLSDAVSFSKQLGEIEKDTIPTIRGFLDSRAPIGVGTISATDAHNVAQQLENEGYNLIKAYGPKALTPNLAKANKGDVMVGVAQDLRAQIDRAAQTEGLLPQMKQQIIDQLGGKYPTIEAKIQQATSVPEIRSIAAPYVNISKAVDSTIIAHQAPLNRVGQNVTLGIGGAGAGFGVGGPIGAGIGMVAAPAIAGGVEAARPALTSIAARGILGGAGAATKFGPTVLGQVGAHALGGLGQQPQPPTSEPQTQIPETGNIGMGQVSPTQQDILRQRLGAYIISRARNANDLVAGYNLLYPKQAQNAQQQIRAKTGIDVIRNIQQIPKTILARTGTPEAGIVNAKLNTPGNIGRFFITPKENDLASLEQQYFILVQGVLTALQGSRPSDYDVKSYQNKAGPSIQFPNYVNQQRIQNLLNLLESASGQQPSSIPLPANYPGIGQ